jgi:hypothetical protein
MRPRKNGTMTSARTQKIDQSLSLQNTVAVYRPNAYKFLGQFGDLN